MSTSLIPYNYYIIDTYSIYSPVQLYHIFISNLRIQFLNVLRCNMPSS